MARARPGTGSGAGVWARSFGDAGFRSSNPRRDLPPTPSKTGFGQMVDLLVRVEGGKKLCRLFYRTPPRENHGAECSRGSEAAGAIIMPGNDLFVAVGRCRTTSRPESKNGPGDPVSKTQSAIFRVRGVARGNTFIPPWTPWRFLPFIDAPIVVELGRAHPPPLRGWL